MGSFSVLVLKTPHCKSFFLNNLAFLYIKFLFIDLLYQKTHTCYSSLLSDYSCADILNSYAFVHFAHY